MMTNSSALLRPFAAGLLFLLSGLALLAQPPAVADFVRRPEITGVGMSEDGRYVSFLTPNDQDYYDINLFDTQTNETTKLNLGGEDVFDTEFHGFSERENRGKFLAALEKFLAENL